MLPPMKLYKDNLTAPATFKGKLPWTTVITNNTKPVESWLSQGSK